MVIEDNKILTAYLMALTHTHTHTQIWVKYCICIIKMKNKILIKWFGFANEYILWFWYYTLLHT